MTARENILNRIKIGKSKANLWNNISEPNSKDFFIIEDADLLYIFKNSLERINGKLIIVNNQKELLETLNKLPNTLVCSDPKLQALLSTHNKEFIDCIDTNNYPTAFISCEAIVARLGSVLTSSEINSGRQINISPEHQVVFATQGQLVYDIKDAIEKLNCKYEKLPSMISFATGPSRTADIEKTLILGAHGPKMLTIIFQNFSS